MAAPATADDVRAAADALREALKAEIDARGLSEKAAQALVVATESWPSPRFYSPLTSEASGLLRDVREYEVPREHTLDELAEFVSLVDVAATSRAEVAADA